VASVHFDRLPRDYAWFVRVLHDELRRSVPDADTLGLDYAFNAMLTALIDQIGMFRLELTVDAKQHRLHGELALIPRATTGSMASFCQYIGKARSRFAELSPDAPLSLSLHLPPDAFAKDWLDIVTNSRSPFSLLSRIDPDYREAVQKGLELLVVTLVADGLDLGFSGRPTATGGSVGLFGLKVQQGQRCDFLLRDVVRNLSTEDRNNFRFRWNHTRHGTARIHQWREKGDEIERFAALREDVLLLGFGKEVLPELRAVLDRFGSAAPRTSPLLQMQGRLAPWLVDKEFAAAVATLVPAAMQDQIDFRLTVQGGHDVRLRLDMHSYGLRVAPLLFAEEKKK
jgi:hypothetical protein